MRDFAPLLALTPLWQGFERPWCVAGGWAIDLFLGRVTRPHHDVEFAVFREDQALLPAHFAGWHWRQCVAPDALAPWDGRPMAPALHQLLTHRPSDGAAFDVLLNNHTADRWVFRRNAAITRPRSAICAGRADGLRYIRPEITLLYKAKYMRPQDEADLRLVLPRLSPPDRAWLADAIRRTHPGHPWLDRL
jgi:hypothetical protein